MKNTIQKKDVDVLRGLAESARKGFDSIKSNLNFQREAAWALQIIMDSNILKSAKPESIIKSIIQVAQSGLTLNPTLKFAYLIPRRIKGEMNCILEPSYVGLIKVLTDSGGVKAINAQVVRMNDDFELEFGLEPKLKHKIALGERGKVAGVYSIAVLPDDSKHYEYMSIDDINNIKSRSESVKAGRGSIWESDFSEMCRKTVIRRHFKYLPKSSNLEGIAKVLELYDDNNKIDATPSKKELTAEVFFGKKEDKVEKDKEDTNEVEVSDSSTSNKKEEKGNKEQVGKQMEIE